MTESRRARLLAPVFAIVMAVAALGAWAPAGHAVGAVGPADVVAPTGTVSINGGAAKTSLRDVTLTLTAVDPDPGTGVTQMRFSKDGTTWSAYQNYGTTASWELTGSEGTKKVYAQFKDGAGNASAPVVDKITLAIGPRAAFVSPPRGMTGVSPLTNVTIRATEQVKPGTVNSTTVWLIGNGARIPSRVTYNKSKKTITLNPNRTLPAPLTFIVRVKGVKDLRGNKWDEKPRQAGAQSLKFFFATR